GYKTEIRNIQVGKNQYLEVKLMPDVKNIDEVVVKPSKKRYKNRKNPAVELMEHVIDNKDKNSYSDLDYLAYEKYEKIELGVSNIDSSFKKKRIFKKFQFVFENVDTSKIPGKKVLPFYLKESISDYYYQKNPKEEKEYAKGNKMVSFGEYFDDKGISDYMKFLYQEINIYNNNIQLLTNQFLSPLAVSAPTFYKFYIADTTMLEGQRCIRVFFSPRNKNDLMFQGYVYVTADSSFAIKKVDMAVNSEANLNWVRSLHIKQSFTKNLDKYLLTTSEISMDFGITDNNKGIFGQRTISYKDYSINTAFHDSIFSKHTEDPVQTGTYASNIDWNKVRHIPLSKSEAGIYHTMDSVKQMPAFKNAMSLFVLLFSGYRDLGYFEIGPVSTFYSYNPIEGTRVRFGGRTTNKLSKKFNVDTYMAYGSIDKQYKYYGGVTYSLTPRSVFEFPVKSVKVSYQKETKIPGQELQFVQEDNVLLSIKRGINDKLLYNRSIKFEHLNEFRNHFSYTIGYEYTKQAAAGSLFFNNIDYTQHLNTQNLYISEIQTSLRYAPHESFYQGKNYRIPIINKYPVLQLQYAFGNKALGNSYNYHKLKFSIYKRFYLSVLGYSDVTWEAGKIFGKVPFPLLTIHRANQTYSYQLASYNLMNFLEFVSDQYTSINVDHCFNGFFFNKIPLMKKLKFREVASFKAIYGSVDEQNKNGADGSLFQFPVDANGTPVTYSLEKKPYIEASVGISNIFKFFRIDVVKRLTYLNNPNVASIGLRMRFKFDF
ncbi:MAG TPA: DUF5686 family protein, partial [Bacteroidales bacterium]|nr:DUF5686 family protein [Bacteroidales bacterium]